MCRDAWSEVWLSDACAEICARESLTLGEAVEGGQLIIVVPNVTSSAECSQLAAAASAAADALKWKRVRLHMHEGLDSNHWDDAGCVRLPSIAAAGRACATQIDMHQPLSREADGLSELVLQRLLLLIDEQLPSLVPALFGSASNPLVQVREPPATTRELMGLYQEGALGFSSREPAVNIYDAGGEFLPHMDHEALTILLPLTSPDGPTEIAGEVITGSFSGGGTGFWSTAIAQGARGGEAPTLVLRPPAGTAMIFGGHLMHAGIPVDTGTRVCFVASFSALDYDYDYRGPRPRLLSCGLRSLWGRD